MLTEQTEIPSSIEKPEIEKTEDLDEKVTNALKYMADLIAPEAPAKEKKQRLNNQIIIKPLTKLILEDTEWRWGCKIKDEAIKLENKIRERAINYPNEQITKKIKEELVWSVVNEEKQKEAVSEILAQITDLIDRGEEVRKEEIQKMIENSENQKYLDLENIYRQTTFIKEARESLGFMHKETQIALIKYILSNKSILKLKDLRKYTTGRL